MNTHWNTRSRRCGQFEKARIWPRQGFWLAHLGHRVKPPSSQLVDTGSLALYLIAGVTVCLRETPSTRRRLQTGCRRAWFCYAVIHAIKFLWARSPVDYRPVSHHAAMSLWLSGSRCPQGRDPAATNQSLRVIPATAIKSMLLRFCDCGATRRSLCCLSASASF